MEQAAQLEAIKRYTIQKLGSDSTGHGLDHIMRVVRMTKKLIETEAANEFIAVAAAYLHDTIDEKLVISVKEAEEELEDFLRRIDLTNEQIQAIMDIISNMSFADTLGDARPTLIARGPDRPGCRLAGRFGQHRHHSGRLLRWQPRRTHL
jgi:uncharacterized protein